MKPHIALSHASALFESLGITYGEKPYLAHLQTVKEFIEDHLVLDLTPETLDVLYMAAYEHDTLEDTPTSREQLREIIGEEAELIVFLVSGLEGERRREKQEDILRKLAPQGDELEVRIRPLARLVKLADRISNVRSCLDTQDKRIHMYRKEHAVFRGSIWVEGEWEKQWAVLDDLLSHKEG